MKEGETTQMLAGDHVFSKSNTGKQYQSENRSPGGHQTFLRPYGLDLQPLIPSGEL